MDRASAIRRVAAETIHEVVCRAVAPRIDAATAEDIHAVVGAVRRVEVLADEVRISLTSDRLTPGGRKGLSFDENGAAVLVVATRCRMRGGRVDQVLPPGAKRPRAKRDPALIRGLQQAHQLARAMGWRAGDGSLDDIRIVQPTSAYERKLVRIAFLAPDIQRSILDGTQAPTLTLARLLHEPIPTDWADQRRAFGDCGKQARYRPDLLLIIA